MNWGHDKIYFKDRQSRFIFASKGLARDFSAKKIDDLIESSDEIQVLLMAYRIEPNSGQIEALRQHSDELAADLLRIYRLPPGTAPQLEALASGA